jgi:AmiR/NasT family two-component response regulator
VLTAYTDYAEQAREIGVQGYVVKPLDRNTLLHKMTEALAQFEAA